MLWQDHRNDLIINGFGEQILDVRCSVSDLARYSHVHWWEQTEVVYASASRFSFRLTNVCIPDLDPLGAIIVRRRAYAARTSVSNTLKIAFGVIISWSRTVHREFELLAGKSAPHTFLQLIVYKAATFSADIIKLDTVRAYHVRAISFFNNAGPFSR